MVSREKSFSTQNYGATSIREKFQLTHLSQDQTKEVSVVNWKNCGGGIKNVSRVISLNSAYLQAPFWVWFFTVFTFYDPPFARVCHMLLEVSSFHGHMAIFVVTSNNYELASFQVSLF